jgi:hypothetical protein
LLIEEKAERMHQNVAQQAVAQMPQITRPDSFHLTAIGQLTKDRIDEVANAPQHRTLVRGRLRCMRLPEWGLQQNTFRAQVGLQIGKPIVAIPHDQARGAFQQERHNFSIGFIGRCQEDTGEQTRPTQLRMHPKAIKRLSLRMIFAIAGLAPEAHTPRELAQNGRREEAHCPQ